MAVIEYDAYKQKLLALEPTLKELEQALNIEPARKELAELQIETEQEGFWNDVERSQRIAQKIKRLENKIKKYDHLVTDWEDTLTLCEMAQEEDDASQLDEVASGYETLEKEVGDRRLAALLTGEYDANNAILTTPGPAALRPRIGRRCSTACTPAGPSGMALPISCWTMRTAMRRASSPHPSSLRGITPMVTSRVRTAYTAWCG